MDAIKVHKSNTTKLKSRLLWLDIENVDRLTEYVKKSKSCKILRVQLLEGSMYKYLVEYQYQ